ncbi:ferritin-like fold-containing protein [Cellulomonas sp. NPDC089187]|uniref:ferritin-like fold-containing protein n=1 Tax=Cellulomonas sp. NPDC089187 TaxID=3154970 RepID=UPI00342E49BC
MTSAASEGRPEPVERADGADGVAAADTADTVELLGLVAHLQHVAFGRLAEDAHEAPTTAQQLELSRLAAAAVQRRDRVLGRVAQLGGDPERSLGAYTRLLDDFDNRTQPSTWWERLLRSYVAEGVSDDFCRIAAGAVDDVTRELLLEVLDDAAHAELAVAELETAGAQDEVLVSRLALWGRRLVGEALGVVQQAMAGHPSLARLIGRREGATTEPVVDQPATGDPKLFGELTAEHTRRMSRLGLTA